ncbi:Uncharacterised protein [Burkholderia pseudomallei]|nr:Uncharacterised protein [Burkholderia pseudomallei]
MVADSVRPTVVAVPALHVGPRGVDVVRRFACRGAVCVRVVLVALEGADLARRVDAAARIGPATNEFAAQLGQAKRRRAVAGRETAPPILHPVRIGDERAARLRIRPQLGIVGTVHEHAVRLEEARPHGRARLEDNLADRRRRQDRAHPFRRRGARRSIRRRRRRHGHGLLEGHERRREPHDGAPVAGHAELAVGCVIEAGIRRAVVGERERRRGRATFGEHEPLARRERHIAGQHAALALVERVEIAFVPRHPPVNAKRVIGEDVLIGRSRRRPPTGADRVRVEVAVDRPELDMPFACLPTDFEVARDVHGAAEDRARSAAVDDHLPCRQRPRERPIVVEAAVRGPLRCRQEIDAPAVVADERAVAVVHGAELPAGAAGVDRACGDAFRCVDAAAHLQRGLAVVRALADQHAAARREACDALLLRVARRIVVRAVVQANVDVLAPPRAGVESRAQRRDQARAQIGQRRVAERAEQARLAGLADAGRLRRHVELRGAIVDIGDDAHAPVERRARERRVAPLRRLRRDRARVVVAGVHFGLRGELDHALALGRRRRIQERRRPELELGCVDRRENDIGREQHHRRGGFFENRRVLHVHGEQHAVVEIQAERVQRILIARVVLDHDMHRVRRDVFATERRHALALVRHRLHAAIERERRGAEPDFDDAARGRAGVAAGDQGRAAGVGNVDDHSCHVRYP